MATVTRNFDLYIGESSTLFFKVSSKRNGVISNIDLTNKSLFFKVSILENDEFLFTKHSDTEGGGINITNFGTGVFEIYIEPADTEAFATENKTKYLKWVLTLEYDDIVKVIKQGVITLLPTN